MNLLVAPLFGSKHLLGLLFVVVIVVGLFLLIRRKEINIKKVLLYLSIAFIVLELINIVTMTIDYGEFPMNHIPLHLCSLPLYVFPILYFSKEGSMVEKYVKPAAYATTLAAAIAALLIPTNILGNNESWIPCTDNFYPFISFIYHGLMIFAPAYMLYSGYYKPIYSDIPKAMLTTGCLMVLALIANAVLDKDFMLLNRGNGSPLQFLLDNGQLVYTSSMILLGFFVISLVIVITISIRALKRKQDN